MAEFEALLRALPDDALGRVDRTVYLAAALTGLRQGELLALRWRDIDWAAGVIRCRRAYTPGKFGTPKSRRASRAVPMADRLAAELERQYQRSAYRGDDDLALCHPETGSTLDPSKLRRRYKRALAAAGLREVRFHDLRHTFGTHMAAAGALAGDPGVDGLPRLQDDVDLRGPRAGRDAGTRVRGAGIRRRERGGPGANCRAR